MKVVPIQKLIPIGTVLNQAVNGTAIPLQDVVNFSVNVVFTGTPTGTFKLQGSSDITNSGLPNSSASGLNAPAVNWTDLTGYTQAVSASGSILWNFSNAGISWVRLAYVDGSGGTSTAVVTIANFYGKGW